MSLHHAAPARSFLAALPQTGPVVHAAAPGATSFAVVLRQASEAAPAKPGTPYYAASSPTPNGAAGSAEPQSAPASTEDGQPKPAAALSIKGAPAAAAAATGHVTKHATAPTVSLGQVSTSVPAASGLSPLAPAPVAALTETATPSTEGGASRAKTDRSVPTASDGDDAGLSRHEAVTSGPQSVAGGLAASDADISATTAAREHVSAAPVTPVDTVAGGQDKPAQPAAAPVPGAGLRPVSTPATEAAATSRTANAFAPPSQNGAPAAPADAATAEAAATPISAAAFGAEAPAARTFVQTDQARLPASAPAVSSSGLAPSQPVISRVSADGTKPQSNAANPHASSVSGQAPAEPTHATGAALSQQTPTAGGSERPEQLAETASSLAGSPALPVTPAAVPQAAAAIGGVALPPPPPAVLAAATGTTPTGPSTQSPAASISVKARATPTPSMPHQQAAGAEPARQTAGSGTADQTTGQSPPDDADNDEGA